ncbi:MAG: GIY-YIG nuclease family protein [Candidatus Tectomicrobia bacterium]|uniref:GIY-YIG nuclease family protein n=1 Tax=Tectimicrobiota bacterium TaxID=2528274 RepID=A0A932GQF7_UNCTE|nr:GIY-YIG nuclease family protein [Candidatus Tectomicrobia bacterium]
MVLELFPERGSSPWPEAASGPGCYQLLIQVNSPCHIAVSRLGEFLFPAGTYVYTGSALAGLKGRVSRHLSDHKIPYWHIDYLLAAPWAHINRVLLFPGRRRRECTLNLRVQCLPDARVIAPRFGCGDCRRGCLSHLFHLPSESPRIP